MINLNYLQTQGLAQLPAATASAPAAPGAVDLSSLPAGSAAYYAGQDWNRFMTDYQPLIERQLASLNSEGMVKRAREDAAFVPAAMSGAVDRAAQRRGGVTGTQRIALGRAREANAATTAADIINNARMDQRQRNSTAALDLSGLGTDIYQMGLDNVRESEGLAAQRRVNNANAKQQSKQNLLGAGLTLASMVAFSDARLKVGIVRVGSAGPFGWYRWTWAPVAAAFGLQGGGEGVLAQEVEQIAPHLVHEIAGYKAVDYAGVV